MSGKQRCDFRREVRARDSDFAQPRQAGQRGNSASIEVVTAASPDLLDGLRTAQGNKAVVARGRILAAEEPQMRHRGDARHGRVGGIERKPAEAWKAHERLEA